MQSPSSAPSSFDLNAIRNAVPERGASPVNSLSSVNGIRTSPRPSVDIPPIELLPNEILGEIFDILRVLGAEEVLPTSSSFRSEKAEPNFIIQGIGDAMDIDEETTLQATIRPSTLDPLLLPLSLASVSRRFNAVITSQSTFWTHIYVDLQRARSPSILATIISRSSKRAVDLKVRFPDNRASAGYSFEDEALHMKCWSILAEYAARLSSIDLEAPNNVLHAVTRQFSNRPLPLLTMLSLSQPRGAPTPSNPAFFGPFYPTPAYFKSFTLNHTSVRFGDSSCLGAVKSVSLNHSSGALLDQRGYVSFGQRPNGPIVSAMRCLERLSVVGTTIGIPFRLNANVRTEASSIRNPFIPCFTPQHLRHLEICGITSRQQFDVFHLFLRATYTPLLETLKLDDLTQAAWECVMHFLRDTFVIAQESSSPNGDSSPAQVDTAASPSGRPTPVSAKKVNPIYRDLHALILSGLPSGSLVPFFLRAFPNLRTLELRDKSGANGAGEAYHLLRDPSLCPLLELVVVGGQCLPRPPPVLMITAS
ncbi:hypothetical protein BDQ17DRAFT_1368425 [Cyathus striatus]|nr:hypothetical protein BDQ17DRAFT_1368425 [Cyathus striatus]